MLALAGVKLYSTSSFPLLHMTPLILPMVAEKKFMVMLLPMVLLAQNDCAIDRTGPSSYSNRVND